MTIIVSKSGRNAARVDRTRIESENYLQQYICANPDALPLYEYKDDIQFTILAREFPVASGFLDAIGVDQDGEIYIIETKCYQNSDKRHVLAQVLDYGASLWRTYSDTQEFIAQLQDAVADQFDMSLREKLAETFEVDSWDGDEHLAQVRENVAGGRFHFVVLMNRLDDRLKDLIAFVNQNSHFDVFGVELELYQYEDLEILIPRIFGVEMKKSGGASSSANTRRSWNEQLFFEEAAARLEPAHVESMRRLYEWAREKGAQISWGTGKNRGSFNPKFEHLTRKSVFGVFSDGELTVRLHWHDNECEESQEIIKTLGNELLSCLEEFPIPRNFMEDEPNPIPVHVWSAHLPQFIEVLERVLVQAPRPGA